MKWNNDQFVDIYESGDNHKYGMIKSSHKDKSGKITLCYSDFFHSRLINKNFDPLILLTFENVKDHAYPWLIVETLVNHDQIFGRLAYRKKCVGILITYIVHFQDESTLDAAKI